MPESNPVSDDGLPRIRLMQRHGRSLWRRGRTHQLRWIHRCVSKAYSDGMSIKDTGIRIRVESSLREAFVQACRAKNRSAAEVLRGFMRSFAESQERGQIDLFAVIDGKN